MNNGTQSVRVQIALANSKFIFSRFNPGGVTLTDFRKQSDTMFAIHTQVNPYSFD